jgi:hypothetical protein
MAAYLVEAIKRHKEPKSYPFAPRPVGGDFFSSL